MQPRQSKLRSNPNHRPVHLIILCAVVLTLTFAIAAASPPARAQEESSASSTFDSNSPRRFYASLGFGFDFSRGDYGSSDMTNVLAVPASLKLEWEPVTFRLSVPYSVINGSEGVLGGEDGPTGGGGSFFGTSLRHGLGDIVTSLAYTYYPSVKGVPVVDLITKIKIPTASSDLGTGKTDVTLQLELSETLGDFSVFGSFGYRFKGGSVYDDIVLVSTGVGYRLTRSFSMGLAYDFREASASGVKDSQELSPYLSFRLGKHLRFGPYGVMGLSESAPDWGLGANFTWNF